MHAMVLMYHDVVERGEWETSGFPGLGAALYKIDRRHFADHLHVIAEQIAEQPARITDLSDQPIGTPLLLTFDDGGASAYTHVAGMLEDLGWRGHFFVATDYMDSPAFLTRAQVRELHQRGHVIGSHTASHPLRLARCSPDELTRQWRTSVDVLSDVIGEQVDTASAPGGQYTRSIGAAAASAGVRVLFTSEATTTVRETDGMLVVGRFAVKRGASASSVAMLARCSMAARARHWLFWHAKRAAKTIGGDDYLTLRAAALRWLPPPR